MDVALRAGQRSQLILEQGYEPFGATSIRRDDDAVLRLEVFPDVAEEGRLGVQVVHWASLLARVTRG